MKTPHRIPTRMRIGLLCLLLALAGGTSASGHAATATVTTAVEQQSMKERQRIAGEMFQELCKKSGVFIHRTVENVEGVFLMRLRPDKLNFENKYALDDPYGRDVGGKGYIELFLKSYYDGWPQIAAGQNPPTNRFGYQYVEAIDPSDGVRYRYNGSVKAVRKKDVTAPDVQANIKRNDWAGALLGYWLQITHVLSSHRAMDLPYEPLKLSVLSINL
ncbi:hypothetical protein [Xylophilus ampelinus]|uniref:Uncharacterized protein n=1 Tax=Xylophilus ampelinus TaxID=54067 RepID=A0A318SJN2_9BURK|nr:hypothetical protein [Xylophilus ampelinus]MCS4509802.1 hypothetical protein [Xylophilus ampelinus]PYE78668.1 hypothetical protein DFQ15_10526 [Xylophilus ampelinus]